MSDDQGDEPRGEAIVVSLAEETLHAGTRQVETGRLRVSVTTEAEDHLVRETLRTETMAVERVVVGRELGAGERVPAVRREADGTLVVPVVEEILVVEKRLVLREELWLRITFSDEAVEETVTLRRQQVAVERLPPAPAEWTDPFDQTSKES